MVRIELEPVDTLPDIPIHRGGPVGAMFLDRGIDTFGQACRWVKQLPYGSNSSSGDCTILFADGCGTCFTKHGVIATLAAELGLSVHKNIGFYRMNDEIVAGVDALLQPYGLSYVPQIHCFLEHEGRYVDLTEGNANGKNKIIDAYDFILRVTPEPSRDEMQRLYAEHLKRYADFEPRLAALPMATVTELLQACGQVMAARHRRPSAAV